MRAVARRAFTGPYSDDCRRHFSSAPRSHLLNTVVVRTRPQTERATDSAIWSWRTAADGVSERAGPRCFGGAQTPARSAVERHTGHYAARAGRTSPSPGRASRRTVFPDEGAPAIRRLGGHRVVLSGGTGTSGHCACDLRAWLRHGWHRGVLIGPSCVATAGPKARVLGRRCGSLLVRRLRFSWGRFATGRSHPVACHFAEEKEVIVPT